MNKAIEELNTWNNPATLSHDEIKALVEKAVQQERERIIEEIEKLRDNTTPRAYFQEGYNRAIDDIVKTLKQ